MKINILLFYLIFLFVSCAKNVVSSTDKWMKEYEILLQKISVFTNIEHNELSYQDIYDQLRSKESELDSLLNSLSMQDQLKFLSSYYDLKMKYSYNYLEKKL